MDHKMPGIVQENCLFFKKFFLRYQNLEKLNKRICYNDDYSYKELADINY